MEHLKWLITVFLYFIFLFYWQNSIDFNIDHLSVIDRLENIYQHTSIGQNLISFQPYLFCVLMCCCFVLYCCVVLCFINAWSESKLHLDWALSSNQFRRFGIGSFIDLSLRAQNLQHGYILIIHCLYKTFFFFFSGRNWVVVAMPLLRCSCF